MVVETKYWVAQPWHIAAAVAHIIAVVTLIIAWTKASKPRTRIFLLIIAVLLTFLPIFYWWYLSSDFEYWYAIQMHQFETLAATKPLPAIETLEAKVQLEFEKRHFEQNKDNAKVFWAAVTAILVTFTISRK
jgi:Zn-dependent protease with chaperone function